MKPRFSTKNRRRNGRLALGALTALGLFLLIDCTNFRAYYNTFFLAEKTFKAAEQSRIKSRTGELSPTTKKLYEEAINRASRILVFYPESKYLDDALLMIGKSYYYTGEYQRAERKFQEVIAGFPKSGLQGEAQYFLGLTHFRLGDIAQATSVWQKILESQKQKKFHQDALFSLAELKFEQKEYGEAIALYRKFLNRYKKDRQAAQVQLKIAEGYWLQEDYEAAWKAYAELKNITKDKELVYQAEFKAGQAAFLLERFGEGMAIYKRLAENADYYSHLAEVKLQLALGHQALAETEEALRLNQEVFEAYPQTTFSAQAYFQQGVIYQEEKADLKTAQELFEKAKGEKAGSEYAKKALEKSADITKLELYKKALSEGEAEKIAETQFLLAEFYLTHLNQPDSALASYRSIVSNHPQSELAPKALLAAAYICRNLIADTAGCRKACEELIKNYPSTDYAAEAARIIERSPPETESPGPARLFQQAEEQFFTFQNPDSASRLYQQILDLFPGSVYAPRALLGKAHILEHHHSLAEDTILSDSTVYLAYASLMEKYPESEAAGLARLKLGLQIKPQPKPPQPAPADTVKPRIDTVSATAVADTADTLVRGLPQAPEPVNRIAIEYPPQLIGEKISGWVYLKMEIDYFTGEIRNLEIMQGGGLHPEIDRRVYQAMSSAKFDPQRLDPRNFSGIYGYRFKVVAPVTANP